MTIPSNPDNVRIVEDVVFEVLEPVRRYLSRRAYEAIAEDVLSKTLFVLWSKIESVPDDAVPWAIGVARLQLANAHRAQRRQDRLTAKIITTDPPPTSVDPDVDVPDPAGVRDVLQRLPARDAEILRLSAWEDLPPAQIAVVLGITTNAATVRLHRARKKFATEYQRRHTPSKAEETIEGRTL